MAFSSQRPSTSGSQRGRSQDGFECSRTLIYRTQLDNLKHIRDSSETTPPDTCIDKVKKVIEQMQGLEELDTNLTSAEMCLDLHVTNLTGKVIREQCLTTTANIRQVFDEAEFIEKLSEKFVKDNEFDFVAIGLIGRLMLKPVPGYLSRMGHLSVEAKELPQKERKQREARKKDAQVAAKAPEKLTQAPNQTEDGVDKIISRVVKALRKVWAENGMQPISYFNFVLHPTDFAKTVQNMFHFSFAIKDGLAEMDISEEGYPVIVPKKDKSKRPAGGGPDLPKKQMITSLSKQEWRELVRAFRVTEATLDRF